MRGWRETCPRNPEGELEFVFPNTVGRIEMLNVITERFFKPLQRRLGIANGKGEPCKFHSLRHTAAWRWIKAGVAPKQLQTWMGHSRISMTFDVYGGGYDDPEDDQAKLAKSEQGLVAVA